MNRNVTIGLTFTVIALVAAFAAPVHAGTCTADPICFAEYDECVATCGSSEDPGFFDCIASCRKTLLACGRASCSLFALNEVPAPEAQPWTPDALAECPAEDGVTEAPSHLQDPVTTSS